MLHIYPTRTEFKSFKKSSSSFAREKDKQTNANHALQIEKKGTLRNKLI